MGRHDLRPGSGRRLAAWIVAMGCMGALVAASPAGAWETELVAVDPAGGEGGAYADMATDAAGNLHLSSRNVTLDCLQYTTNASGAWQSQIVDPAEGSGYHTSIAVDGGGGVHISYLNAGKNLVLYATNASGSWETHPLGEIERPYLDSTSIALDGSGHVHILYARIDSTNSAPAMYDAEVRHVTNASGMWVTEPVAATVDGYEDRVYARLGIDSQDRLHICYYASSLNTYFLYYASEAAGWTPTAIDYGKPGGLRLDVSDAVHISYFDPFNDDLKYAHNATGAWQTETVDAAGDVGGMNALALDGAGGVHVAYLDSTNVDLRYAFRGPGGWVSSKVADTLNTVTATAIAAGGGAVRVCYADNSYGGPVTFRLASDAGGGWSVTPLPSRGKVGEYCSVAMDGQGVLHASYYDAGGKNLMYASNDGGSWATSLVDSQYDSGRYSSMGLDSAGAVHVAYHQYQGVSTWNPIERTSLRYATNASGAWARTTIESMQILTSAGTGLYVSLGIDSQDHAHISYYKETMGMSVPEGFLRYATNRSGAWIAEEIEGGSYGVGKWTSLAVNDADLVCLSYQDGWRADLKYATDQFGGWVMGFADLGADVGRYTSIAQDAWAPYLSHISYYDRANGDLKHCSNEPDEWAWACETVDSSGDVGLYTSIAVDAVNRLHISYLEKIADSDFFRLKYARRDAGGWESEVVESAGTVRPWTDIAVDGDGTSVHIVHTALDGSFRQSYRTCADQDEDGFYEQGGACGPADCDDTDPGAYPGAQEVCDDGVDNSCSGWTDCEDPTCSGDPACQPTPYVSAVHASGYGAHSVERSGGANQAALLLLSVGAVFLLKRFRWRPQAVR